MGLYLSWYLVKAFLEAFWQILYIRLLVSSSRFWAQTVESCLQPLGVSTYPTIPTTFVGGVSTTEREWTTSFLSIFFPSLRSWYLTQCVIPALYPMKAVMWQSLAALSLGQAPTLPL